MEKIEEFDDNGNLIYYKNGKVEIWSEYDNDNNEIHTKYSNGREMWRDFNEQGNLTHYKDSDGNELWYCYDRNGNEIYYKDTDGCEIWSDDEQGIKICSKTAKLTNAQEITCTRTKCPYKMYGQTNTKPTA